LGAPHIRISEFMTRITPDHAREIVALDDARTTVRELKKHVASSRRGSSNLLAIIPVDKHGNAIFVAPATIGLKGAMANRLLDQLEALLDKRLAEMSDET
jgi:hypothetical protein